jgi:hypothetical protein
VWAWDRAPCTHWCRDTTAVKLANNPEIKSKNVAESLMCQVALEWATVSIRARSISPPKRYIHTEKGQKHMKRTPISLVSCSLRAYLRVVILVCTLAVTLSGCSTRATAVKIDQDNLLPERGYLLLGFDTNRPMYKVIINGAQRTYLNWSDLPYGAYYTLVELPAGNYHIDRIYMNPDQHFELEDGNWVFEVHEGEISYIGDLVMKTKGWRNARAYMELVNRSSFALEFIEKQFGQILNSRFIRYAGPGEDAFLSATNELRLKQGE